MLPGCCQTDRVITVWVDRESVAMGDDTESHVRSWQLPDDAVPADVLVEVLGSSFLAHVVGDVAWTVRAGRFDVEPRDGWTWVRPVDTSVAAVVHQSRAGERLVTPLDRHLLFRPFTQGPTAPGPYAMFFGYSSEGVTLRPQDFAAWAASRRR